MLIGWKSRHIPGRARLSGAIALTLTTLYLFYGVAQNRKAYQAAQTQLSGAAIKYEQLHVYPTLLQPWLRRVVAWVNPHVKVGYYSTLAPQKIAWTTVKHHRQSLRVKALIASPRGQIFKWFSNDQLVAEAPSDEQANIRLHDFRYGMIGAEKQSIWGFEGKVSHDLQVSGEAISKSSG